MSENKVQRAEPSRRVVCFGAAATTTLVGVVPNAALAVRASIDPSSTICERWLATEAERQRLQMAWGDYEDWLARTYAWHRLSDDQRRAIPEGGKLNEISKRLDVLNDELERLFEALLKAPVRSVAAVIANLTVAGALIFPEDHPGAHGLIDRAVRGLSALDRAA